MEHTIWFIEKYLSQCIWHEESQTYDHITYLICFTSNSSLKRLVKKSAGWDFVSILWFDIYFLAYDENWCSLTFRFFFVARVFVFLQSLLLQREAAGIIHNGIYSVNCVHISCRYERIMVLCITQVLDERVLLQFFYTKHSISVLGRWAKSWFYIRYSIFTQVLIILIKGWQCDSLKLILLRIIIN